MKRKSIVLLTVIMTIVLLGGCSSKETKDTEGKASGSITPSKAASSASPASGANADIQKIIDAGVLKVGCKADVPSFGYQNTSTSKFEGLEVDLAYAIAGKIFGCTMQEAKDRNLCEFQAVNAKTRGPLLDNGEIDIVAATFTITEERKTQWNFSTPYIEDALGLMCLTSSGFTSIKDLDGCIIGVAQSSTTKDAISAYITEQGLDITVEFQEFPDYPSLSAALSSENIDVFSVDRAILAGYNTDKTMILPERFGTQEYGIASKLGNDGLAALINEVIDGLKSSGELKTMITGWGIE